ncbi:MAG: hypothetical protein ACKPKO_20500, partial [Candidatus Fonsibacter sp.]
ISAKPTSIMYFRADLSSLTGRCDHKPEWRSWKDWKGNTVSAFKAHLPLVGRRSDDGTPATKAAATYPFRLNMELAKAIINAGRAAFS